MNLEEAIVKHKLDKRVRWLVFCGEVVRNVNITLSCSGCTETPEYTNSPERGLGCHECGYTGKRMRSFPEPAMYNGKPIKVTTKP